MCSLMWCLLYHEKVLLCSLKFSLIHYYIPPPLIQHLQNPITHIPSRLLLVIVGQDLQFIYDAFCNINKNVYSFPYQIILWINAYSRLNNGHPKILSPNPWDIKMLSPNACDKKNVMRQKGRSDVLRILRREDYPELLGWAPNTISCTPVRGREREF